jgi:hypothetical protein
MNSVLKVGAAGTLALAGVAAHASIASPSIGSSDAILFAEVVTAGGATAVASYAGDTGYSINSLLAGGVNTTVLGSDANLAALFNADASGDTIEWGIMGAQYQPNGATQSPYTAAAGQFLTTTTNSRTNSIKNISNSALAVYGPGFAADISTINSNANGALSTEGANPATHGVWDITNTGLTSDWYGGLNNNNVLGGSQTLFYMATSTGGNTTLGTYSAIGTVSLSSAGLNIAESTNSTPPVPLPAAVWLLGSGLLGLTGVARRKLKA